MNYFTGPFIDKFAEFEGRASRKEYWYFYLIVILVSFVLGFVEVLLGWFPEYGDRVLSTLFQLVIFVPWLALGVRRAHDTNTNGWFSIIPFYNLYLFCLVGDKESNKYGPVPTENK